MPVRWRRLVRPLATPDAETMDVLAALRLQIEWGADEALLSEPLDRRGTLPPAPAEVLPPRAVAPAPAAMQGDLPSRAAAAAAAAASPAELRAALDAFDPFGLAATAASLAFVDGDPAAGLVLVGDVPGAEEDVSGVPFKGPPGRLLDAMLASIGLDRRRVLLTLLVPWRPPGGRAPSETELAACLPFLHRHLALLRPRRIVALGALPARALLGRREPISRLRGRWHEAAIPGLDGAVPLLPMLQPTQLLAQPEQKARAWVDWRLLRRTLDGDGVLVNAESGLNA